MFRPILRQEMAVNSQFLQMLQGGAELPVRSSWLSCVEYSLK